mgnify:CR=1 FL=1
MKLYGIRWIAGFHGPCDVTTVAFPSLLTIGYVFIVRRLETARRQFLRRLHGYPFFNDREVLIKYPKKCSPNIRLTILGDDGFSQTIVDLSQSFQLRTGRIIFDLIHILPIGQQPDSGN